MGLFGKIRTAFSDFTEDIVQDEPQQATASTGANEEFAGQNHNYGEATQVSEGNVNEGEMEYATDNEASTASELDLAGAQPGDMVASNDEKPEDADVQIRTADFKEPGFVGEPFPVLEPGYEFDGDSESVIDVPDVEDFLRISTEADDEQEVTPDAIAIEGHEIWQPESAEVDADEPKEPENVSDYLDGPIDLDLEEETHVDGEVQSDGDVIVPLAPLSLKIDSHYLNDYRSESLRPTAVLASGADTVSPVVVDDPDDVGVFVSDSLREEAEEEELATVEEGSLEEESFEERGGDEEIDAAGSLEEESFGEGASDVEDDGVSLFEDVDSDVASASDVNGDSGDERFTQVRFDSVGFVGAGALGGEDDEPVNLIDGGLNEPQDNELDFSSGENPDVDGNPRLAGME